jgi:hypothetical protein
VRPDDERTLEQRLAAHREQQEARSERNVAAHQEIERRATQLLEQLRDHPSGSSLPSDLDAEARRVAQALPASLRAQLEIYLEHPELYDLAGEARRVLNLGLDHEQVPGIVRAVATEVAMWSSSMTAIAAQLTLLHELRRRGYC